MNINDFTLAGVPVVRFPKKGRERCVLGASRHMVGCAFQPLGNGVALGRRVVKESSDSGVELKQAAESVATANGPPLGI